MYTEKRSSSTHCTVLYTLNKYTYIHMYTKDSVVILQGEIVGKGRFNNSMLSRYRLHRAQDIMRQIELRLIITTQSSRLTSLRGVGA